MNHINNLN